MTQKDWHANGHVLGLFLNGREFPYPDRHGQRITDDSFLLLFNGHHEDVTFTLPARRWGQEWELELCTGEPEADVGAFSRCARETLEVQARSVTVLRRVDPPRE
jgi:glycogen operon protein